MEGGALVRAGEDCSFPEITGTLHLSFKRVKISGRLQRNRHLCASSEQYDGWVDPIYKHINMSKVVVPVPVFYYRIHILV